MTTRTERLVLILIVAFHLALGAGYAVGTPAWEAPDEPAHYNYIRHLAENGTFPVLQMGDYDVAELERLKAAKFPPSMSIDGVRYEYHQPPLYYLLAAPVYKAAAGLPVAGQVVALRLLSVLLGALVLAAAYAIAARLFPGPGDVLVRLGTPAILAAIPMHTALSAAINNDTLAEPLLALILYLCLLRLEDRVTPRRYVLLGGMLLGLGLLTKVTVYVGAGLFVGAEVARWTMARLQGRQASVAGAAGALAGIAGLSLAIGAGWFARNAVVYGNLDILGRQRHDLVVTGQPRTVWGLEALRHFLLTTFNSFWGQFGWMGIPLDQRIYAGLAVLCGLAAVGVVAFAVLRRGEMVLFQHAGLGLAGLLFAMILGGMAQYNLDYIQPQGRYLFPAATPVALALALGLREVGRLARVGPLLAAAGAGALYLMGVGRMPSGLLLAAAAGLVGLWRVRPAWAAPVVVGAAVAALAALDVWCLVGVVAPYFR